jgi:hypothetical protein
MQDGYDKNCRSSEPVESPTVVVLSWTKNPKLHEVSMEKYEVNHGIWGYPILSFKHNVFLREFPRTHNVD